MISTGNPFAEDICNIVCNSFLKSRKERGIEKSLWNMELKYEILGVKAWFEWNGIQWSVWVGLRKILKERGVFTNMD